MVGSLWSSILPVPVEAFSPSEVGDSYLWVGQMTPYKRADIAIEACNQLGRPLTLVGGGEMRGRLQRIAGPTVNFRDNLSFDELKKTYARAKALIFTAEEDFGIVPVEMQAAGRPVLAYGRGGVLDSLEPDVGGLFFDSQTVASVVEGLHAFDAWLPSFDPVAARASAARFSGARFDVGYLAALASFSKDHPELTKRFAAASHQTSLGAAA